MNKLTKHLILREISPPHSQNGRTWISVLFPRMGQKRRRRGFLPVLRMGDGAALYDQPNSGESFIR